MIHAHMLKVSVFTMEVRSHGTKKSFNQVAKRDSILGENHCKLFRVSFLVRSHSHDRPDPPSDNIHAGGPHLSPFVPPVLTSSGTKEQSASKGVRASAISGLWLSSL